MGINYVNRYALAIEILKMKPRISIVHKETGLPLSILRQAYIDMHGQSPSKGSLRAGPSFILKNLALHKQAILFCVIFETMRLNSEKSSIQMILSSYNNFLSITKAINIRKSEIDFSESWQLAKWLINKTIHLERCSFCQSTKLFIPTKQVYRCSVCRY